MVNIEVILAEEKYTISLGVGLNSEVCDEKCGGLIICVNSYRSLLLHKP